MAANPDHIELAETAKELIDENGAPMQLFKETTTGPSYDPVTTPVTEDVTGVRSKFSAKEIGDGSRIKSTDIKILIDAAIDPTGFEKIIDGTRSMQIIEIMPIEPGEVKIMNTLQCRL